jgi:hypothetical protein
MALFVKNLMAQTAFIETLQSTFIKIKAAIFGGARFVLNGSQVADLGSNLPGFCLNSEGILKASGAEISGGLSGKITNGKHLNIANDHVFNGTMTCQELYNKLLTIGVSSTSSFEYLLCTGRINLNFYSIGNVIPIFMPNLIFKSFTQNILNIYGVIFPQNTSPVIPPSPYILALPGSSPSGKILVEAMAVL